MKAVFLDADTLGEDVDLAPIEAAVDELELYPMTGPDAVIERLQGCDTAIVNKVVLKREHFEQLPQLRAIVVTATGVNNIDLEAAQEHGIRVVNAIRYGTAAVAQHTFSLILALAGSLLNYAADVHHGRWQQSPQFCLMDHPMTELEGKTLGIVGYGELGHAVARLGQAFGMEVLLGARPGQSTGVTDGLQRVALAELLPRVDVLSLHCLLSEDTRDLIGWEQLRAMKSSALLINTARGGIVNEEALVEALRQKEIAGAGFDVLTREPPVDGNPLLRADIPNLIVTPHCAWATQEARQRMVEKTAANLRGMRDGTLERWVV
ncbi:D-2-hydroxyacid dehydrogenase [Marinobacteraceae bacterium S3BR75-40.1]